MKYKIFPGNKPPIGQPIYIIGSNGKEELAIFKGDTRFDSLETDHRGFYSKWWRLLRSDEIDRADRIYSDWKKVNKKKI